MNIDVLNLFLAYPSFFNLQKNSFYCHFGPSALQLRIGGSVVISAVYDVWYGEEMQDCPSTSIVLTDVELVFRKEQASFAAFQVDGYYHRVLYTWSIFTGIFQVRQECVS